MCSVVLTGLKDAEEKPVESVPALRFYETWVQILALPLNSCVTLGMFLNHRLSICFFSRMGLMKATSHYLR